MSTTLFSIPKPFEGHTGLIQDNAIRSWLALSEKPTIVLFGNEAGVADAADRFGLIHVPVIKCNERGTPFVNDVFERVRHVSITSRYVYINGDIIVMEDFGRAIRLLDTFESLIVGRRWNLNVETPIDTGRPEERQALRQRVPREGRLFIADAIDYFGFHAGMDWRMPAFLVGRPRWDNWMIYEARRRGLPVVDITASAMVVHQNHEYAHIADSARGKKYGEEGEYNKSLFAVPGRFNVFDATHVFDGDAVRPANEPVYLSKRISTMISARGRRRLMGWILRVIARGRLLARPGYRRLIYRMTW